MPETEYSQLIAGQSALATQIAGMKEDLDMHIQESKEIVSGYHDTKTRLALIEADLKTLHERWRNISKIVWSIVSALGVATVTALWQIVSRFQ